MQLPRTDPYISLTSLTIEDAELQTTQAHIVGAQAALHHALEVANRGTSYPTIRTTTSEYALAHEPAGDGVAFSRIRRRKNEPR